MAELPPLHPGLGTLVVGPRPHPPPGPTRHSPTRGSRQTWVPTDDAGRGLTPKHPEDPEQLEPLIRGRLADIKSALVAADPDGTGLVSREEFRRVLKRLLSVSQNQLDSVLSEVCERGGETADYTRFLRRFSRTPAAHGAGGSGGLRRGPRGTPMSLPEILKQLKDKINQRSVIRVLSRFDCNREGRVGRSELRRVLDDCCLHLTDDEFHRLWTHFSPDDTSTMTFDLFLDQLGFSDSRSPTMAPVCTKLEVSSRRTTPPASAKPRQPGPEPPSSPVLQILFYHKMCVSSTPVWRALQAFDATRSGLVERDVLRAVLGSFIFPMNPHSFQKLTGCYGVRATGPVRWKHFLGHFVRPEEDPHTDRASELHLQDVDPRLKEIFHQLDENQTGQITRADLQILLERPDGTRPRTCWSRTTELLNVLDPEQTGVSQLARLERLDPGTTAPPASPAEERQSARRGDKLSLASASWRRVEDLPLNKLCEQLSSAVKLQDPQQTGSVTQEDLKGVFSCRDKRSRSTLPSGPRVAPDARSILDVVFWRMRSSLEERRSSLSDRIRAVTHGNAGALLEADVRKILEDSGVVLNDEHFQEFAELLGVAGGGVERSAFLAEYEASGVRRWRRSEGQADEDGVTSAERCLAVMKTRIKIHHGDTRTAFRAADRKRRGVLDGGDLRRLCHGLGLSCSEAEHWRLLDLMGLCPGKNLNLAEFIDVVENNGKRGAQTASVPEQLHELLAFDAGYKWPTMSKALCQFDGDGEGWIAKTSLRRLLFSYALPLSSDQFHQLWSRYDPEGRGRVAAADFLEKLGCRHGGDVRALRRKLNLAGVGQNADRPATSDAASLERIEQVLQENHRQLSAALSRRATGGGGMVAVEELLSLLQTYSCSIRREQLVKHLHRLEVRMDEDFQRLAYMDFLSAFDHKAKKSREPPPATPDAVRQIESLDHLSPGVGLARLRDLVAASAPHLHKAFSAFSQSGTAALKALDFRHILESFCARLSDKQFRLLLTELQLDPQTGTVDWQDFLHKFRSRSPPTRTTETPEHLQQIHDVVSGQITKDLTDLNPSDSTTIPKEQFRCPRLTHDQLECVPSPFPESRETTSCRPATAGGALQHTKSAPQTPSRRPASVGSPWTGSLLGSSERRLRAAVRRRWKQIQRNCAENDPRREGRVDTASFLDVLRSLGVDLTREQLESLAATSDVISGGCVRYHDFLRHFLLDLKPAETRTAREPRRLSLSPAPTSRRILSEGCVEAMLRIGDVVRPSWTAIRRCLLTYDAGRAGSVSVQDFRKVLLQFGVTLSSAELFHLSSDLDAGTAGRICYKDFLWACLR